LRAEHEFRKRTELEDRLRQVEDHLALRAADRQFEEEQEQLKRTQKAKTDEERYRHVLQTEVCRLNLTAPGVEDVPVSLDDTFVHLNFSEHDPSRQFPLYGDPKRAVGKNEDLSPKEVLSRAFQEYGRKLLLIIGDPGSGKTTLLKYYALCCLKPDGHRLLGFDRPVFPFYLPLREIDRNKSLAENLSHWANQRLEAPISADEFQFWLEKRDSLILLDGLDEISQLEDRQEICGWIDKKNAGLKRGRLVVTSRGNGIRGQNLVLNTPNLKAEVRDFSDGQREEFLRKWFRTAYQQGSRLPHESESEWRQRQLREAESTAEQVIDYLKQPENLSLRQLTGIPMLLQLLALIWKQYGIKPETRTEIYDIALDYLLEYRDEQPPRRIKPLLKARKARRVLSPVSLWMQEELTADEVAKDKMHDYIAPILEPIDNTVTAEDLCANLRDRAGLIADYGKNEYIFRHKSFREYFAGLQLVNSYHENKRLGRLVETFGESWWAETLRYFISRADGKAFSAFINAFFNSEKSRELSQEQQNLLQALMREAPDRPIDAFLACLRDDIKNEYQQRYALDCLKIIGGEPVRQSLEFYLQTPSGKPSTIAYTREILAGLAAPAVSEARKAAKPKLFAELPPAFRNPVEYNAEYILIRGGTIKYSVTNQIEKVPDLYFAKYPVTNKQYRRFIRYLRGEETELGKVVPLNVFSEKLLEFIAPDQAYIDYLSRNAKAWPDKLTSKYEEDRKFNGEDQPVVGVSWYAARAYCFWLSVLEAVTDDASLRTPGLKIADLFRLPNEVEWERAAVGRREEGPPRKYPWPAEKGEPNEKLANYGSHVGQTTPVGRYPEGATPEGLMDMAGNVWEWMENKYGSKDYPEARALRGGSWYITTENLRCVARIYFHPLDHWNFIGFRVVCGQF